MALLIDLIRSNLRLAFAYACCFWADYRCSECLFETSYLAAGTYGSRGKRDAPGRKICRRKAGGRHMNNESIT